MSTIIHTSDSRGPSFDSHRHACAAEPPEHLAAQIVETARAEARQILSDAETAATALRSAAERKTAQQQAALADAGQHHMRQELQAAQLLLASVTTEIQTRRDEWLAAWQHEALNLALAIAGRVLRRKLDTESELALQLVRESLDLAVGAANITVRVSPDDLSRWRAPLESLLQETHPVATTHLLGDPQVSRGGCRVDTEFGGIDQTIETQLQRIAEELTNDQ